MVDIRAIAIDEITNPTFGTTKQFLDVLKVRSENSVPVISNVIINDSENTATVYFPVEGEEFFIAIYINVSYHAKITSVSTEAGTAVYLSIGKKDEAYTELPMVPDKVYNDAVIYGIDIDVPDTVENKIVKLLNYIEPHKNLIKKIAGTSTVTINIYYHGYRDQMWGLHLDPVTLKRISDLNAEFDFDIYAEGKELYSLITNSLGIQKRLTEDLYIFNHVSKSHHKTFRN